MTADEIRTRCDRWIEAHNAHDLVALEDLFADGFVELSPSPGSGTDKAAAVEMLGLMFESRPDVRAELLDTVVEGSKAMMHTRFSGTDTNGFFPGMPPTAKRWAAESIDVVEFDAEGKVLSHYGIFDVPAAMAQLGLLPPSTEA